MEKALSQTPKEERMALLKSILGQVFVRTNSYREPDVVQIVGWTKGSEKPTNAKGKPTRINVRTRDVNLKDIHNGQGGGHAQIDWSDVVEREIFDKNSKGELFIFEVLKDCEYAKSQLRKCEDGHKMYFLPVQDNDENVFHWCDY